MLQVQRMVEHFRVEQLATRQSRFTGDLSDRCTLTEHAPPEQLLSGLTRVLERLATTVHLGAFATSAHPNRDQYLVWKWSMHALEALSEQFRLVEWDATPGLMTRLSPATGAMPPSISARKEPEPPHVV